MIRILSHLSFQLTDNDLVIAKFPDGRNRISGSIRFWVLIHHQVSAAYWIAEAGRASSLSSQEHTAVAPAQSAAAQQGYPRASRFRGGSQYVSD